MIKTKYLKPLNELSAFREQHLAYFQELASQKIVILGGRMSDSSGAIILANVSCEQEVQTIMRDDPYCKHALASYEVIEFDGAVLANAEVKKIFNW